VQLTVCLLWLICLLWLVVIRCITISLRLRRIRVVVAAEHLETPFLRQLLRLECLGRPLLDTRLGDGWEFVRACLARWGR
jgi:hypothetical protein